MKKFFKFGSWILVLIFWISSCQYKPDQVELTIYCTTDIHGNLFDFDL